MANTTQKRLAREAFIHRNRNQMRNLIQGPKYVPASNSLAILVFVNEVARAELGYADGTDPDSIWFTLYRAYRKLYPPEAAG